jgi:hypothetical protein
MTLQHEPHLPPFRLLFLRHIIERAEEIYREEGFVSVTLFLAAGPEMTVMHVPEENRDFTVGFLKDGAKRAGCDFSVLLSEGWGLKQAFRETLTNEEFGAIARSREGLAGHPERESVIAVSVEDPRHVWVGQGPINESANPAERSFGVIQFLDVTEHHAGRMMGFVHKEFDTPRIPLNEPPLTGDFRERLTQALEGMFAPMDIFQPQDN